MHYCKKENVSKVVKQDFYVELISHVDVHKIIGVDCEARYFYLDKSYYESGCTQSSFEIHLDFDVYEKRT